MQYQIRREQINDPGIAGLIDSFIEKSNCGTIFHTTAWNRIVSKQFGSELFYFLAYSGQNIVGVLPCHFVRNSRYTWISYSPPRIFEVSYGGPVSIGPKAVEISKALAKAAVKIRPATFLSIFNSPLNTKWAHHSGRTKVISFETAYVDLEPSLEQIWTSSINGKRRNMIRKAQREGVEVKTWSRWGGGVILMGDNNVLKNCTIHDHGLSGAFGAGVALETWGSDGAAAGPDTSHDNLVENNKIYGNTGQCGIYVIGADNNKLIRNIIYDNTYGIEVVQGGQGGSTTEA